MSKIAEVVSIAKNILDGKIGSIEASRKLVRLRFDAGLEEEEALTVFRALESETDHLPIGRERQNYLPQRLKEIDMDIRSYEEFYQDTIKASSMKLIEKYSDS